MVQCHFQASWQRGHVRLWRWTGTAANHGGPSPGRRPAVLVRRARSLELQEPDLPVWTVRGMGGWGTRLYWLYLRAHFNENHSIFSWGMSDFCIGSHWCWSTWRKLSVKFSNIKVSIHIISHRAVRVWWFLSRGLRWINLQCRAKWITELSLWG